MSQQSLFSDAPPAARVTDVPVYREISESFMAYAMSVITARAIPDVRDGLKPVQRRVLWSMLQMGVRPGTPFRKSARIVGDTMGRYHPHGDDAIYDTLVRLGQDFARMLPLVEPQGNFGSLDDPPAASRYTECRLAGAAMGICGDIDESTVDFLATYDGEDIEPEVMPAALPNLLINGAAGIAVGMATNMPSHNPTEVADAIELVMGLRRKARTDELLEVLPGPDFCGGGIIVADDGLREAYDTGRGNIRVRARMTLEPRRQRPRHVVVTELPPGVGAERVVSKVAELVSAERLNGVSGAADLSDLEGLRVRIDLNGKAPASSVLKDLYRLTPLEETFSVNNVVLVGGVPLTLNLRQLCEHYIEHRIEVVVRRSRHRLDAAKARMHLVDGELQAVDNLDEVVAIIRRSKTAKDAAAALCKRFDLSDKQAQHILDMRLRRLTGLERLNLEKESAQLRAAIKELEAVLASSRRQRNMVKKEMREICDAHARDRRAEIVSVDELDAVHARTAWTLPEPQSDRDESLLLTVTSTGNVGQASETRGRKRAAGRHDMVAASVWTTSQTRTAAVTSTGRVMHARAGDAAPASSRARGGPAAEFFGCARGERVLALTAGQGQPVMLVTSSGLVKRIAAEDLVKATSGAETVPLSSGESVVAAFVAADGDEAVVVSDTGNVIRFEVSSVPVGSLARRPSTGMRLPDDGTVVAAAAVAAGDGVIVAATSQGGLKATEVSEIPLRGRGGNGVLLCRAGADEKIVAGFVGAVDGLLAVCSADDDPSKVNPTPVPIRVQATRRYTAPERTARQIRTLGRARW